MLRKSIALIMSVCMLLSLCACGKSDNKKSNSKNSSDESNITDTYEDNPSFVTPEKDNAENTPTSVKPEDKLSKSCSMILCTGRDGNDYYELVANQIDGYPDSTFEFGVIKNNQWLVPMGSDCPFIDENGRWLYSSEGINKPCDFLYIESGCFCYNWRASYGTPKTLYNPETGVSIEICKLWENPDAGYGRYRYTINDQSEIIAYLYDAEKKHPFTYINMNTGQTKYIPLDTIDLELIGCYSDNLFFAASDTNIHKSGNEVVGFYDLDANQIIDLSSYIITDFKDYKFTNGQYTFTARNNSNVLFDITIDKTGKVLSQEKVES